MAKVPHIDNVTCAVANAEYPYTFPDRVRGFRFQTRTAVDVRFSWQQGQVGPGPLGDYMTLKSGDDYTRDEGQGAAIIQPSIVYFACGTAGTVVEIEIW